MAFIPRKIQSEVENWLFKGKVLIIYGARQVGKTTLVRSLIQGQGGIVALLELR